MYINICMNMLGAIRTGQIRLDCINQSRQIDKQIDRQIDEIDEMGEMDEIDEIDERDKMKQIEEMEEIDRYRSVQIHINRYRCVTNESTIKWINCPLTSGEQNIGCSNYPLITDYIKY